MKDYDSKKFSRQDLDRSDPRSKQVSVDFLQKVAGYTLKTPLSEQPEMYKKWDFTMYSGDNPVQIETEQKLVWTTTDGTFSVYGIERPTVDVSGRKWESQADLFIMLNSTFNALCTTEMKTVHAAPLTPKRTKVGTSNELFYNVPVEQFRFYVLTEGEWVRV